MWREGARCYDSQDVCPGCGANCCIFGSDFKAFGKKSVRACTACKSVYVNGAKTGDLEVHLMPKPDAPAV